MLRVAGLVCIGTVSAVPTQRRALHPYDHCTPNEPAFADLCQSIEDTFQFDTPGADRQACEASVECTYVPPVNQETVGTSCDTAGMASSCGHTAGVEGCFNCVRRYGFAESVGGDCTEENVNDFCISESGNNPCDTHDCGGYAEGHCALKESRPDTDQPLCDAAVETAAGGWGQDPDADATACLNVGLREHGRTGLVCEYTPGALRGVCVWAPGTGPPTCRCEDHWRPELGDEGGACTVHCTGDEDRDESGLTGCRTTPLPTNIGEIGTEQGNMLDPSIMTCQAGEPENPDPCTTWQRAADVYTPGPDDLNPRQSLFDLDQQFCYAKSNLALGIQCEYVALSTLDAGPQQITCPREQDLVVCAKAQHASVGDCLACVRSHFGMGAADGGWEFEDCTTVWEGFCETSHYGGGH